MFESTIHAAGESINPLLPATPDLIWGTVAFVIVALAIYKFAWPTLSRVLDERAEKIEEGLKAAEEARAEVADERERLEAEILQARRDAAQIREQANDSAKDIVSDAQRQARSEADQILGTTQRQIDADKQSAAQSLQSSIGGLATELAGRIVSEAITDQDMAHRVIDRFLDELESSLVVEKPAADSVTGREY